tara:strand:+ start:2717 stop:3601 length:885 start_codon:yes stop_codon:yes gene_type:complete
MKNKIKTLLVGLGRVGFEYDLNNKHEILTHAKSIFKHKQLEFVSAVDKDLTKLNKFKKNYNIKVSNNLTKSIKTEKPNLVIISVDTINLFKICSIVVKNKFIKYIILEKPGATNFKQLKKIYNICKKSKIKLFINYNRSYYKKFLSQFEILKKTRNFKIVYKYNRGLYNNASHFLNLIFHYLDLPKKILILKKENKNSYDLSGDILLFFKNGIIYLLSSPAKKFIVNEGFIFTKNSKLRINLRKSEIIKYKSKSSKLLKGYKFFLKNKTIKLQKKDNQLQTLNLILRQLKKKTF